jgi:hypothetical protein
MVAAAAVVGIVFKIAARRTTLGERLGASRRPFARTLIETSTGDNQRAEEHAGDEEEKTERVH